MKKYIVLLFIISSLVACSKYEDGGINLISGRQYKKVIGEWAVESRQVDKIETPFESSISKYRLSFMKDGNYKESYVKDGNNVVTEGIWAKDYHKYSIYTAKGNISINVTGLKRNDMWFNYIGMDGRLYEYHVISAKKAKD